MTKLETLHNEIGNCTVCGEFTELLKSSNLERGPSASIMIVGIAPGNNEVKRNLAFSGQAGKTLFDWLNKAGIGNNETEIRKHVYLTSIIKCSLINFNFLRPMMRNCIHFLDSQIQLVNPKLFVTLGSVVFNKLLNNNLAVEEIVGNSYTYDDFFLPDMFSTDIPLKDVNLIIPFPHPSGRSTWIQKDENNKKLEKAIHILSDNYKKAQK